MCIRDRYSRGKFNNEPTEEGAPAQPQPVSKKREIIASLKHLIRRVRWECRLMDLSRSSFYYKPKGNGPERMKAEADLRNRIEAICLEFLRYGYRRVTHELGHKDCHVNHKKVLKILQESDLLCRVKQKWVKTTDSRHRFLRYRNLIKGIVISRLN